MRKFVLFCLVLMTSGAWAQDQTPKVAVMPFMAHTSDKTANVQKTVSDLFARQLASEGVDTVGAQDLQRIFKPGEAVSTEDRARAAAGRVGADYAVFGSVNQLGSSVSLDVKLVDVSGRKKTEILFAEEKGMENLAAAVNTVVKQMTVHLMAKGVIADVQVRGNDRIEAEAVKLNAKSKKGDLLRPELVSEDIKAIYKTGYFEKVEAEVSDSSGGKVLTFVVQENPTIQDMRITGNKKIKEKDILAAISTKPFSILQRNVINDDVQKIQKLYQTKGYSNAGVKSEIEFPKDPRKATVVFNINENNRLYVKKIAFSGNKRISDRKLRGVMQTKQKNILSLITDRGILQRDILDTDVDRLAVFYHDKGYMDARIGTPVVDRRDDGFYIDIPVEEGERYRVKDVAVAGDPLDEGEVKLKDLELKSSDYFSREELRSDIDKITKKYMDEGYAYTDVAPDVKKHKEDQSSNVTYQVNKGEKMRIGKIFISGNTKTRDKVIRREMKIDEGDVFSGTKLEKSLTRLKKIDYFEQVEIVPVESGTKGIMDLHVKVKEKFTGSVSVGGGFSSDEGLFATGEISQRNLFGRGQYASLKAHFGEEAARYALSFTEPWLFDRPLSAGFDIYDWLREYDDFTKDATGIRLRTGYPFGNYSRITGMYTLESINVSDVSHLSSEFIRSQEGDHLKSSITLGIERDTTDHPFLPTRGTINSITSELSSSALGSDTDFLKSEIHSGWYIPMFWKFVGFIRGEAGSIWNMDDEEVPIYERFFLGGINSLRGFDWGDVSPVERTIIPVGGGAGGGGRTTVREEKIGGLNYVVANFEILFPLVEKMGMRGVVFYDIGNAYLGKWDFSDLRYDAGVGVRWNSPLGPLRIEWGYNLDPKPGEEDFQWQFSAGAFF